MNKIWQEEQCEVSTYGTRLSCQKLHRRSSEIRLGEKLVFYQRCEKTQELSSLLEMYLFRQKLLRAGCIVTPAGYFWRHQYAA